VTKLPEFKHRLLDALPGDARIDTEPRQVHGALWSRVQPTRSPTPVCSRSRGRSRASSASTKR
jgi:hypothetical protein